MLQASKRFTNSAAFQIAMHCGSMFPRDTQSQPSDFQIVRRREDEQMIITGSLPIRVDAFEVLRYSQVH